MSILAYHMVDSYPYFGATRVRPRDFEKQVQLIRSLGVPVRNLTNYLNTPCDKRGVALTFDDGFESAFRYAFPILERYNMTATVFVIAGYIGQYNTWDVSFGKRARLMNWDHIRQLQHAGWEIGSHTLTHKDLTVLLPTQRKRELIDSKQLIEQQLKCCSSILSYPFGNTDSRTIKDSKAAGYQGGVVMTEASTECDPEYTVFRYGVYRFDTLASVHRKLLGRDNRLTRTGQRIINRCSNATVAVKRKEWQFY